MSPDWPNCATPRHAIGVHGARLQGAEDEVGAREAHDLGVELLGGLERLGDDGADRDDGHAFALA